MKMNRKTANLASPIVQISDLYVCTSTFWVDIGCRGPIPPIYLHWDFWKF